MNILALDLSLTSTGWARYAGGELAQGRLEPNGRRGYDRLGWIRSEVLGLAAGADLVVIEGYSYGSQGRAILDQAALGGVIRMALRDLGYELQLEAIENGVATPAQVFGGLALTSGGRTVAEMIDERAAELMPGESALFLPAGGGDGE